MGSSRFYCMCWRRRRVGTCNLIRVHLVLWLTSNKGICRGNSGVRGQCHARQLGLVKPVKCAKYDNFLFDLLTKKQRSHIPPSSFVDGNYSTINNDVFYAIWATPLTILQLIWWPFQRTLMQVRYSSSIDGNPWASIVLKKIKANDFQLTPIFVCLTKYIIQGSNDADTQHHISSSIW
jgi:hypothetical protein